MFRLRPGRALARAAVGTAVVAGTAGAVHHSQDQRYEAQEQAQANQQQMAAQQTQINQLQQAAPPQQEAAPPPQQQPAPPPPAAAAPAESAMVQQLEQLSQMHNAGILSDQEFAEAKQKLLAGS